MATAPRDVARWAVVLGTVGVAVAYASAFAPPLVARRGETLMAIATPTLLVGVLGLGAFDARSMRARTRRVLSWAFVGLALWLALGFAVAVASGPPAAGGARVAGLPWAAALVLYGLGAVPAVLLPVLYAWAYGVVEREAHESGSTDGLS
jgi:hypothetical protein